MNNNFLSFYLYCLKLVFFLVVVQYVLTITFTLFIDQIHVNLFCMSFKF